MSGYECPICGGLDELHTANCAILIREFGIKAEDKPYNAGRRDGLLEGLESAAKLVDLWEEIAPEDTATARILARKIRELKP